MLILAFILAYTVVGFTLVAVQWSYVRRSFQKRDHETLFNQARAGFWFLAWPVCLIPLFCFAVASLGEVLIGVMDVISEYPPFITAGNLLKRVLL